MDGIVEQTRSLFIKTAQPALGELTGRAWEVSISDRPYGCDVVARTRLDDGQVYAVSLMVGDNFQRMSWAKMIDVICAHYRRATAAEQEHAENN